MSSDRETTSWEGAETPRASAGGRPDRPRRVLFAAYPGGRPTGALLRAHAFSRIFDGELTVLRVLPNDGRKDAQAPQSNLLSALFGLQLIAATARKTRVWSDATLPASLPRGRVLVRRGDFESTVVDVAADIGADLIVLPPAEGHDGHRVTFISTRAGVPVLVAREVMSSEAVVAATDLRDLRFPVVSQALEIAARLGASVVAVHNVSAQEADDACAGDPRFRLVGMIGEIERRRRRLVDLAEAMSADMGPVVVSRPSPTEAILQVARARDADLVVVGTRAVAEMDQDVVDGTAAAVVESSRRSVLVLPFSATEAV